MAVVGIGARNEHALDEHIYMEDMEKALKMLVGAFGGVIFNLGIVRA